MPTNTWSARGHLESLGVDHATLTQKDAVTLSYSLHGWQLYPVTPAGAPPIAARVWLFAALNTRGGYRAPDCPGHPADLEDGGAPARHAIRVPPRSAHIGGRDESASHRRLNRLTAAA